MIGKIISHYKILEMIGRGGMGVVYRAEDTKLKRTVALKFLPPVFATDPTIKERFLHEAQAISALQHSSICTVHDINETEDGQLYIVMDYYEGETLKLKIENGNLKIEEAVDYTIQIAQGLHKAHNKGIIHRDIKPANIMITSDGEIKILDFGLAKFKGQTKVTKNGSTVGTIDYMSPEQTKGVEVDHRSDVWSTGVMMYEMLTGELPFKGDYDQAVVYSILNEAPVSPGGDIPEELITIVNKCLEKNPSDRYQHVGELINDLDVSKVESSVFQNFTIFVKSKVNSIVLITAVLVIVVIGYIIFPEVFFEKADTDMSEWENSIAVLPFENFSNEPEQEYFCDGMTEQIISNLSRLPKLKVIARQSVMQFKDSDKSISEIGKKLDVKYVLESSIRKFGSRIRVTAQLINTEDDFHVWAEDYDKEYKELFSLQDEVSGAIARSLLQTISGEELSRFKGNRPKNLEAWEYYSTGNYIHYKFLLNVERIDYFNNSEEMLKRAIELDPDYAPSYAELADLYNTYYNYVASTEEEQQVYLNLQKKYINAGFKIDPQSADLYSVNGWFLDAKGDLGGACNNFKKSVMKEPNNYSGNSALGIFYQQRGLHRLAIKYLTRAIEFNPVYSLAYFNRSWCYILLGNLQQAELDMIKALNIDPEYDFALWWYAWCLLKTDRITEAREIIKKREKLIPNDDWNNELKSMMYALSGEKEKAFEKYPEGNIYIFVSLKMVDETIDLLSRQIDRHKKSNYSTYLWLNNSDSYDFLRSDPRFQEIVEIEKKIYDENLTKYGDRDL